MAKLLLWMYMGNINEIKEMLNFLCSATCDISEPYTT